MHRKCSLMTFACLPPEHIEITLLSVVELPMQYLATGALPPKDTGTVIVFRGSMTTGSGISPGRIHAMVGTLESREETDWRASTFHSCNSGSQLQTLLMVVVGRFMTVSMSSIVAYQQGSIRCWRRIVLS